MVCTIQTEKKLVSFFILWCCLVSFYAGQHDELAEPNSIALHAVVL